MTEIKLIGNERKENEDLVAIARKNATINELLGRKKKVIKVSYTSHDYIEKAKQLYRCLDNYFFYDANGLIRYNNSDHSVTSLVDNSLLSIDKLLLGDKEGALNLFEKIENEFEFHDNGLISDKRMGKVKPDICVNAAVSVAMSLLGFETKAYDMIKNMKKSIPYDSLSFLWKASSESNSIHTEGNVFASLGLLLCRDYEKAKSINYNMLSELNFNDAGLFRDSYFGTTSKEAYASSNSIYAIVRYLLRENDAKPIVSNIENFFGLTKEGVIINKEDPSNERSIDSIALVFAYLTLAGKLDKYRKK
jgi:hypothetical protein